MIHRIIYNSVFGLFYNYAHTNVKGTVFKVTVLVKRQKYSFYKSVFRKLVITYLSFHRVSASLGTKRGYKLKLVKRERS